MCEFVRSLYFANKLGTNNKKEVSSGSIFNEKLLTNFNCPGYANSLTKPCAVNAREFWNPNDWIIFLIGQQISFKENPVYSMVSNIGGDNMKFYFKFQQQVGKVDVNYN